MLGEANKHLTLDVESMEKLVPTAGSLLTVGSVIAGFGVAMLFFRIQRELHMHRKGERIWIPWADWLLTSATVLALLVILLPILLLGPETLVARSLATAAGSASVIMVSGYVFAILAHYRLIFGRKRKGSRENPEPAEAGVVVTSIILAVAAAITSYLGVWECMAARM